MVRAGGRTTFPQIFVGDRHIGGCDEMMPTMARDQVASSIPLTAA